ncbi:acyl carrier protein [bacterium]|nr:acyl carrier protein [bacterium]
MKEEDQIVIQIIADIMELDEGDITPELTLFDIGADELNMVEVTMALEEAMDIEFPDNSLLINPESKKDFKVGDIINIAAEYY